MKQKHIPTPDATKTVKRPVRQHYSSVVLTAKRDRKRTEALARQSRHNALTPQEKMTKAIKRGGSKKELARIQHFLESLKAAKVQMQNAPPMKVDASTTVAEVNPKTKRVYRKIKKS
jgi:hypothetical protein